MKLYSRNKAPSIVAVINFSFIFINHRPPFGGSNFLPSRARAQRIFFMLPPCGRGQNSRTVAPSETPPFASFITILPALASSNKTTNRRYPPPTHNVRNPIFTGYPLFLPRSRFSYTKDKRCPVASGRVFFLYLSYRCIMREKMEPQRETGRMGQVSRVCAHAREALYILQNELPVLIFLSQLIFLVRPVLDKSSD